MQIMKRNDKKLQLFMQKRAFKRKPVSISVRLVLGNMFYTGKIINITNMGMFIQTKLYAPPKAMFTILVHNEKSLLEFIARVKWAKGTNSVHDGVGTEILNPSINYLDFVKHSLPIELDNYR